MKRKIYWFLVLILLIVILTGCWSRRELNELAIVVAMGVDKSGEQFKVSSQIVNPGEVAGQKGGSGNSPISVYTSTGNTIFEAIRKMTTQSPRKLYAAHLRLFVIGEELAADEGISKTLDLLSRDQELRTDYFILIAKETTAEQVLKILSIPLEKIPANKIFESLDSSEKAWAATDGVTLDELIAELVSEGHNPLLTGLEISGDPKLGETMADLKKSSSPTVLKLNGMAAFKKDKLIGWLDETESRGANYIRDKVKSTIVNVPCSNDGYIGVELIRSKTKITGSVKNETPKVTISVQSEANVADVECSKVDLEKKTTIFDLEKKTEEDIKSKIEEALKKAQKDFETDLFGLGEAIHQEYPKYWKNKKNNWDEEFADLPVNVNVDVKIRRIGTVGNSFQKELKE